MSKNIDQVFIANPITSNASTDLMYFGQSPYGPTDDAAMTFANFAAQFVPATHGAFGVPAGGTGKVAFTAYALIAGGTTSTGNLQDLGALGTTGQVLTSNGAAALPTWQTIAGSSPWTAGAGTGSAIGGDGTSTAAGTMALSYGTNNTAPGLNAVALGRQSDAEGTYSFSMGNQTKAHGHYQFVFGSNNTRAGASANNSFAFGDNVVANAPYTFGFGNGSTALQQGSWVIGDHNINPVSDSATDQFNATFANGYRFFINNSPLLGMSIDVNGNVNTNSVNEGYATTATSAGTTTLTVASKKLNYFTGSTTQTVVLPVVSTLVLGQQFLVENRSSGIVTVQSSGANTVLAVPALTNAIFTCILTSGTSAASWDVASYLQTPAAGGASPWTASGTNSAIGGDGTATATGANTLAYGSNNVSNAADSSLAVGDNVHLYGGSGAAGNIIIGNNGSRIDSGCQACANFGNSNIINANNYFAFTAGNGNTLNTGAYWGMALGASNTLNATHQVAIGKNANVTNAGSMILCDSAASNNPPTDNAVDQFVSKFSGGSRWYVSNTLQSIGIDATANLINYSGQADQSKSVQTPSTGGSITIAGGVRRLLLTPAATLATLTVTMPAAPIDGQLITVSCSQIVTALTFAANAGQSILNAPSAFTAGQKVDYCYDLATTTWLVG